MAWHSGLALKDIAACRSHALWPLSRARAHFPLHNALEKISAYIEKGCEFEIF